MKKTISLLLLLVFSVTLASAAWPLPKYPTCAMFNASGIVCDELWCGVIDCSYDSNRTACLCDSNITILQNVTGIVLNGTTYYNSTEVDFLISNNSAEIRKYIDNNTITLRNNLLDRIEDLERNTTIPTDKKDNTGVYLIVGILGVFAFLGFLFWTSRNPSKKHLEEGPTVSTRRSIQPRKAAAPNKKRPTPQQIGQYESGELEDEMLQGEDDEAEEDLV